MPTKTQRILGYLPRTFRAAPGVSALRAVADAVGRELQGAENALAALMRAHWVDHADAGEDEIDDLARIAALYGLAPRPDEGVEEFRQHLKRYVRTFLEGTVTVQGLLRVTAEALALRIEDDPEDLDLWWRRDPERLVVRERSGHDAAASLLGGPGVARGRPARPARLVGSVDLGGGADLSATPSLRLKVDGGEAVEVDLAAAADDPAAVTLEELVTAIEAGSDARAQHDGRRLTVASPTVGAAGRLDVHAGPGDAAGAVLGLAPRSYQGSKAEAATVTGTADLSGGADLSDERYLRLRVDGELEAEIDCAGADPAATGLDEIRDAVNGALGAPVASHDGTFLTLTSPTAGFDGSLIFGAPAAQDARRRLLGEVGTSHLGRGAQPARMRSPDLGDGVDLRAASRVKLRVDGGSPLTVELAGEDPAATRPGEIAAALDQAFDFELARVEDGRLVLTSPTVGAGSRITFLKLGSGDAAAAVFGIAERSFTGRDATAARLVGREDLSGGVGLMARNRLRLAVDGGEPVTLDLRAVSAGAREVTAEELARALDRELGSDGDPPLAELEAGPEGEAFLALASPTAGASSRIAVEPLESTRVRRFVSRAVVADEASRPLLGFVERRARGSGSSSAEIRGERELHRGTDLSQVRHLRLAVDGGAPFDVDCAGPRPRTTTLEEVLERIRGRAVEELGEEVGAEVASSDGRRLVLASPTRGSGSRLELTAQHAPDARHALLAAEPGTRRGRDATGVRFVGLADLGTGVELPPGSAVALGVDGGGVEEIPLVAPEEAAPAHFTLGRLVNELNAALGPAAGGAVASHDGRHLVLTSPTRGAASELRFEGPTGAGTTDVTGTLFGIPAPRSYHGRDAGPATLRGSEALPASLDLGAARYLRLGVDGDEAVELDLVAEAAERGLDPAVLSPAEVVELIDGALGSPVAGLEGDRLVLTSPTGGSASRLTLEASTAGDARSRLLGDAPAEARGQDPAPAVLEGEVVLSGALDLSRRRHLRLQVDGGEAVDVEVSGAAADATLADEVVAAVDAALPGVASLTGDGRLRLASPSAGEGSRIAVLPRRLLELEEYPPEPVEVHRSAVHGQVVTLPNPGAAEAVVELEVLAPRGTHGAGVTVLGEAGPAGELRVFEPLGAGDRLVAHRGEIDRQGKEGEPVVTIHRRDGAVEPVPAEHVHGTLPVLPRGTSRLVYRQCLVSRFAGPGHTGSRFDRGRFAGGPCREWGVFGASRFEGGDARVRALFAPADRSGEPAVELALRWVLHRPGALRVRLPADLPGRFGGRLGRAHFGGRDPETFAGAVLEPPGDPDHIIPWILDGREDLDPPVSASRLVVVRGEGEAEDEAGEQAEGDGAPPTLVPVVPLGWEPVRIPTREPRFLTLGDERRPARIYLSQEGLDGFLRLDARAPGTWGNRIAVTTRPAGPGRFDLHVHYEGARFENARRAVLGAPLPALADDLLRPGPVGVLQAKAGGVRAEVVRERALARHRPSDPIDSTDSTDSTDKENDHA